jgi:hypothetical protein
MLFKSCLSHWGYQNSGPVWRVVMAFFAAQRAVLPVKENALANVGLHVTLCGLGEFSSAVAKRAIRIGNFYRALARTNGTVLLDIRLSHPSIGELYYNIMIVQC